MYIVNNYLSIAMRTCFVFGVIFVILDKGIFSQLCQVGCFSQRRLLIIWITLYNNGYNSNQKYLDSSA